MASLPNRGKLYPLFSLIRAFSYRGDPIAACGEVRMVGGISIAMFIALVGWGSRYFGWSDPDGKVQLALVTSFILGVIGGFKARGS
ncbi:hypothetical protein [Sphingomonas sp. URHD0057]|uniref:hypothetical protein n=1 Tax=Sphingomonas sp. URHD0057 TaxID=1380389 RepID=UPI0012DDB355|nr:hypothetical protein [Sphingomonas sp. URHD0057]